MHEWCGKCPACLSGDFHACQNTKIHGLNLDGCFAEYLVVPVRNIVLLPEDLPQKAGAILDPLGNAVHTALKVPPKGKNVAVIGYGPIGAMSVEVLLFEGAKKIWITDVNPKALDRAKAWVKKKNCGNRVRVLSTAGKNREETTQVILEESGGGVDVILEISGHPNGINDGLKIVRAAGDYVQLGLPSSDVTIHDFGPNVVFKGITIHAIIGREVFGTWEKMLELHERGFDIAGMVTGEFPIEEFETALNRFIEGEEQKVVLRMNNSEDQS
jgi:threonine 3-dehydrogenase